MYVNVRTEVTEDVKCDVVFISSIMYRTRRLFIFFTCEGIHRFNDIGKRKQVPLHKFKLK